MLCSCLLLPQPVAAKELVEVIVLATKDSTGLMQPLKPVERVAVREFVGTSGTAGLIDQLPGVSLNGQGGSLQAYAIRGLSRGRIQTRLAGVPLHTERRAGVSAAFLDPFLVGQLEVLKGAGSTLYGSGAMGGVVAMTARFFDTTELQSSYFSEGNQRMFGLGTGTDQYSLGVAVRHHDRSREVDGSQLNDGFQRLSAAFTGHWQPLSGITLDAQVIAATASDIGKSAADYPAAQTTVYPHEDHFLGSLNLSAAKWSANYYIHDSRLATRITSPVSVRESDMESLDTGLELQRAWLLSDSVIRLGLDWHYLQDVRIKERDIAAALESVPLDGRQKRFGLFVDWQGGWGESRIHAAGRYTRVESDAAKLHVTDAQWTGTLLVSRSLARNLDVYGELSTGFRFPALTETAFSGVTPRGRILGNPDLDAETSTQVELGLDFDSDEGRIRLAFFRTRIQDFIERQRITDQAFSYRNVTDGRIRGVELLLQRNFAAGWRATLSGHWLRSEQQGGGYLQDGSAPELQAQLAWQGAHNDLHLTYGYRHESDRVHPDELPIDRFRNLSFGWNWTIQSSITLSFWAQNLLNADYRRTSDDLSPRSSHRGAGLSLKWYYL